MSDHVAIVTNQQQFDDGRIVLSANTTYFMESLWISPAASGKTAVIPWRRVRQVGSLNGNKPDGTRSMRVASDLLFAP